eukprot:2261925-Prymnesium_polylepis.1
MTEVWAIWSGPTPKLHRELHSRARVLRRGRCCCAAEVRLFIGLRPFSGHHHELVQLLRNTVAETGHPSSPYGGPGSRRSHTSPCRCGRTRSSEGTPPCRPRSPRWASGTREQARSARPSE